MGVLALCHFLCQLGFALYTVLVLRLAAAECQTRFALAVTQILQQGFRPYQISADLLQVAKTLHELLPFRF
jgi:hypothetical protein